MISSARGATTGPRPSALRPIARFFKKNVKILELSNIFVAFQAPFQIRFVSDKYENVAPDGENTGGSSGDPGFKLSFVHGG